MGVSLLASEPWQWLSVKLGGGASEEDLKGWVCVFVLLVSSDNNHDLSPESMNQPLMSIFNLSLKYEKGKGDGV